MKKMLLLVCICALCAACTTPQPPQPDPDPVPVPEEEPYVNRMYLNTVYNESLDAVISLNMTKENVEAQFGEGEPIQHETEEDGDIAFLTCMYGDILVGYRADDLVCYIFVEESADWVVKYGVGIGDSVSSLEEQFAYPISKVDDAAIYYMNESHMFTQQDGANYFMRFAVSDNKIQSIEISIAQ